MNRCRADGEFPSDEEDCNSGVAEPLAPVRRAVSASARTDIFGASPSPAPAFRSEPKLRVPKIWCVNEDGDVINVSLPSSSRQRRPDHRTIARSFSHGTMSPYRNFHGQTRSGGGRHHSPVAGALHVPSAEDAACPTAEGAPSATPSRRRRQGGGTAASIGRSPPDLWSGAAAAEEEVSPPPPARTVSLGPLSPVAVRVTPARLRTAVLIALLIVSVAHDVTPTSILARWILTPANPAARGGETADADAGAKSAEATGSGGFRRPSPPPPLPPAFGVEHGREIAMFPPPPSVDAAGDRSSDDPLSPPADAIITAPSGSESASGANAGSDAAIFPATKGADSVARGLKGGTALAVRSARVVWQGGRGGVGAGRKMRRPVLSFARAASDGAALMGADAAPIFRPSSSREGTEIPHTLHPRERIIHGRHAHVAQTPGSSSKKEGRGLRKFVLEDLGAMDPRAAAVYEAPTAADGSRSGALSLVLGALVGLAAVASLSALLFLGVRGGHSGASHGRAPVRTRSVSSNRQCGDLMGDGTGPIGSGRTTAMVGGRRKSRDCAHRTV